MIWILFALLTALFESFKDLLSKKAIPRINEYVISFSIWFFQIPILLALVLLAQKPVISLSFWIALAVTVPINAAATLLFIKALKVSDISLSMPMLAFTPVFLLLASPIIIGEFPNAFGLIGIALVVIGAYIINIKESRIGLFHPFRALVSKKGPRYMLAVAFLWSITSSVDKIGILGSSPYYWNFGKVILISACLAPLLFLSKKEKVGAKGWAYLGVIGIFYAIALTFQMLAMKSALVAYVIPIKRLSIVFGVIWGHLILKERHLKERLLGSVVMIIGIVIISVIG